MGLFNPNKNYQVSTAERFIISGILHLLNHTFIIPIVRDGINETYEIPFYFALPGNERFLYDAFMKPLFENDELAQTQYDKVPRGVISHTGTSVKIGARTNPFVYGKYVKSTDKGLKTYYAKYRPIPISMSFDCKIFVTATLDLYKVTEQLLRTIYKDQPFYVATERIKIPAIFSLPDEITKERQYEFNFGDKKIVELNFSFDVFAYIPNFDDTSEIFAGKRMQNGITNNVIIDNTTNVITTMPNSNIPIINIPDDTEFYHSNQ